MEAERREVVDDYWGGSSARMTLADTIETDTLVGLEEFSHAEIIFCLDRVDEAGVIRGARHPRDNPCGPRWVFWPSAGSFL